MKPSFAPLFVVGVMLALLIGSLGLVVRWRVASGDVFPNYSSLRADPLGLRALHDSLDRLPDLSVDRHLQPLASLPAEPARTIVVAGVPAAKWSHFTWAEYEALNRAARNGSRVVLALKAAAATVDAEEEKSKPKSPPARKEGADRNKDRAPDDPEKAEPLPLALRPADLNRSWGVTLKRRLLVEREGGAARSPDADAALPARLRWESDVSFATAADAGWHVLYRRGGAPVLLERPLGRGTLVLAGDSYFLSNEALQKDRSTALLAWVIGPPHQVTFEEGHLGVVKQSGVATLARTYGLGGAFGALLLLAALYIWRQSQLFVPAAGEPERIALRYHPAAGLERLLRRALSPSELMETCVAEWRRSAREGERAKLAAAAAAMKPEASPVARYNAAVRALRKREPLSHESRH